MPYIICKGSGYEARRRVVRLQKDLINKCTNDERSKKALRDFNEMNNDSGLFKDESNRIYRGSDKVDITKNLDKPLKK